MCVCGAWLLVVAYPKACKFEPLQLLTTLFFLSSRGQCMHLSLELPFSFFLTLFF